MGLLPGEKSDGEKENDDKDRSHHANDLDLAQSGFEAVIGFLHFQIGLLEFIVLFFQFPGQALL